MMKTTAVNIVLRQIPKYLRYQALSTAAQPEIRQKFQSFRTTQSNPLKHTIKNNAQFYTIPSEDKEKLFSTGGLTRKFQLQCKTFNETCLMIRDPALDIINCLKFLDYSKPVVRFVLYGKMGSGKSLTLAHLLHYCYKSNFLIVHVPWVGNWMRHCKESSNSETKEGYIDTNIDAAAWLIHFKQQNEHLLNNPNLKTSEEYVWSKRETTPKDSPLTALIDHGINRIKYASNCVVYLAEEIKRLSTAGHCKTFVAIDGFNAFFHPNTNIKTEKREIVHPQKVIITEAFMNLTNYSWRNGVVVVTVDQLATGPGEYDSHLPKYLLLKYGFEHLDPFIPIFVDNYSQKELTSCMDYYRERKWITPYSGQDEEIAFVSSSNPYSIMNLCSSL